MVVSREWAVIDPFMEPRERVVAALRPQAPASAEVAVMEEPATVSVMLMPAALLCMP